MSDNVEPFIRFKNNQEPAIIAETLNQLQILIKQAIEGKLDRDEAISTATYSNTSMKNGSLELYKCGKIVQFICSGDIKTLATGEQTYITEIAKEYRPKANSMFRIINSSDYILICFYTNGKVSLGNYKGSAITSAQNGSFNGTYITS